MKEVLRHPIKNFRTRLNLKCRKCGHRTVINTEPMVCEACGTGKEYTCFNCHTEFNPATLCLRCHWFVCPRCGACYCKEALKTHIAMPLQNATKVEQFI